MPDDLPAAGDYLVSSLLERLLDGRVNRWLYLDIALLALPNWEGVPTHGTLDRQIPNHDNAASECNHGYPQNLATSMPVFYTGQKEQTAEQSKLR